ncbi:MAG: hypothetical protein ACREAC_20160 [Blastocatellia bacterium]
MLSENDIKEELSYAYVHAVASRQASGVIGLGRTEIALTYSCPPKGDYRRSLWYFRRESTSS